MTKKCFVLCFFLFLSKLFFAQNQLSFINFSEKDGLNDKYIYGITQDKNNTIWIGTGGGLYRYDGHHFTKVNSPIDKPGRQINNVLQNVYCDKSGKIWLSSINALQVFDPATYSFKAVNYSDKTIDSMIKGFIMGFTEDRNGNIWIATQKDYWYKYNRKTQKATHFIPKDANISSASKCVLKILETTDGKLWAITTNGLLEFSSSGRIIPHWNIKNGKLSANQFYDGYFDDKRKCIWLAGGFDGIVQYNPNLDTFQNQPLIVKGSKNSNPANFVTLVKQKDENTIWFSAGILGEYSITDNTFFNYGTTYKDEYSYKLNQISRLFHDREKNLWITSYSGLSMLPWQNNQIKTIPLFNQQAEYTIEPYTTLDYKGGYLIANNTSNGLIWIKPNQKDITLIENPFYKGQYRNMKGIEALVRTKRGQIYAASAENLFYFDQATNSLIPIDTKDQNGNKPVSIIKIISDSFDNLFMTSYNNGFYVFNTKTQKLMHYNLHDVDAKNVNTSSNMISPRIEDAQGNIWFTNTDGVYCWERKKGIYKHYAYGKAKNNGATITQSIDIIQDEKGRYWISTLDNGIFELVLDGSKTSFNNYAKVNSNLPSDYCANLITDKKGILWIGTSNGLVKFDTTAHQVITVMGQQNGFKDNFMSVKLDLLSNGEIAVNHYGSLAIFNPKIYKINALRPELRFTEIKVFDRFLSLQDIASGKIELKHNQNFLSFEWSTDVFNNSNQARYAYKLEGFDDKWVYTTTNQATYSSLEDGDYTFVVKSANNDGLWGNETKYKIHIATPFWKAWWFYLVIAGLVFTLIYVFYQFKMKQVRKEEELKSNFSRQLAEIEMKALRAQMNPHFIFNSLNSIQKYILKNDTFAASQYLTKFSKLIRLILDHSNQNFISLSSEIELLKLYVEIEDMRFDNQFDYHFEIAENLNSESIQIPSMIIQPYIENAIWHGLLHKETKGRLSITFKEKDGCIKVVVDDDGIGREKALEIKSKQVLKKKSYGLQITEDRIAILNKTQNSKTKISIIDKMDNTGHAIGTRVELLIPVKTINHD